MSEYTKITMKPRLQDLSTELLIKIFEYCGIRELYQLQKTCILFHEIIKAATSLGNNIPLLVTNQLRQEIRNRSLRLLTLREKCRISYNWKNGVYKEKYMLKSKNRYIPWLILTRDYLWISKGSQIYAYKKNHYTVDTQKPYHSVGCPNKADVCKFVFKQNYLVSGHQNGSVRIWKPDNDIYLENCHQSDIHSVDLEDNVFVTGSKDGHIKIWSLNSELQQPISPLYDKDMSDRVWSTAVYGGCQHLAVGTAGLHSIPPLHIFDMNRCTLLQEFGHNFRKGSGILQIKWESPFVLLTCGYDKNIRKWDIRTGACEQAWEDPFYSTVYCFDTDNHCTVLTGTESHGRVVLWDMRAKNYIQMYFMETCRKAVFSSPVYSLSFDVSHLFVATDRYLNIMDFSVRNGVIKSYNNIFSTTRRCVI